MENTAQPKWDWLKDDIVNDGDEIVCGKCGEVAHTDLWEFNLNDGDVIEEECGECGAPMLITASLSVVYRAQMVAEDGEG